MGQQPVLQKVSAKRKQALAQSRFASALRAWADAGGYGMVGTEWHLKLREGDELIVAVEADRAILRPVRSTYRGALKGQFKSRRDIAAFLRSERESWRD